MHECPDYHFIVAEQSDETYLVKVGRDKFHDEENSGVKYMNKLVSLKEQKSNLSHKKQIKSRVIHSCQYFYQEENENFYFLLKLTTHIRFSCTLIYF